MCSYCWLLGCGAGVFLSCVFCFGGGCVVVGGRVFVCVLFECVFSFVVYCYVLGDWMVWVRWVYLSGYCFRVLGVGFGLFSLCFVTY